MANASTAIATHARTSAEESKSIRTPPGPASPERPAPWKYDTIVPHAAPARTPVTTWYGSIGSPMLPAKAAAPMAVTARIAARATVAAVAGSPLLSHRSESQPK